MGAYSERLHRRLRHPNEAVVVRDRDAPRRAALKGQFNGNCNRTACQVSILDDNWFNTSTRAYYCRSCARSINGWSQRDEGIVICVAVTSPDDKPPFPRKESVS